MIFWFWIIVLIVNSSELSNETLVVCNLLFILIFIVQSWIKYMPQLMGLYIFKNSVINKKLSLYIATTDREYLEKMIDGRDDFDGIYWECHERFLSHIYESDKYEKDELEYYDSNLAEKNSWKIYHKWGFWNIIISHTILFALLVSNL